jgi:hypothetical protein
MKVDETPFQVEIPAGQYGHKVFPITGVSNIAEEKIDGTARSNFGKYHPFQRPKRQR